jgi:hypothetical protein
MNMKMRKIDPIWESINRARGKCGREREARLDALSLCHSIGDHSNFEGKLRYRVIEVISGSSKSASVGAHAWSKARWR